MQTTTIAVTIVLTLAATTTLAGAEEHAARRSLLHQSGCVDFSGEYMGCLSFGPRPSEENRGVRDDASQLRALVSGNPNSSSRQPLWATTTSPIGNPDVP